MRLKRHKDNWEQLAKQNDPFWVVDTRIQNRDKKSTDEFYRSGERETDEVVETLRNLVNFDAGKNSVLDFGCGTGRLCWGFQRHFLSVTGVDISETMIANCSQNPQLSKSRFKVLDTESGLKSLAPSQFDLFFSVSTFQHINPLFVEQYIRDAYHLLKPNGLMVFQVHDHPYKLKTRVKETIRSVIPLNLWESYLARQKTSLMEIFSFPSGRMNNLIQSLGLNVLKIVQTTTHSGSHCTFMYYLSKI